MYISEILNESHSEHAFFRSSVAIKQMKGGLPPFVVQSLLYYKFYAQPL